MSTAWHDAPFPRAFFTAVQFLTRLPVPGGKTRDLSTFPERIGRVAQTALVPDRRREHVEGQPAPVGSQNLCDVLGLVDVLPCKRIDENSPGIIPIVFDLSPEHVLGLANAQAGLVRPPHGNVNPVLDRLRNKYQPVGGNSSQRNLLMANLTEIDNQRGFSTGQNHIRDPSFFFRLHQCAPSVQISVFPRKLFIPLVIITPVAANIAAVGHVIGGFPQEKPLLDLLPALQNPGVGQNFRKFPFFCGQWVSSTALIFG